MSKLKEAFMKIYTSEYSTEDDLRGVTIHFIPVPEKFAQKKALMDAFVESSTELISQHNYANLIHPDREFHVVGTFLEELIPELEIVRKQQSDKDITEAIIDRWTNEDYDILTCIHAQIMRGIFSSRQKHKEKDSRNSHIDLCLFYPEDFHTAFCTVIPTDNFLGPILVFTECIMSCNLPWNRNRPDIITWQKNISRRVQYTESEEDSEEFTEEEEDEILSVFSQVFLRIDTFVYGNIEVGDLIEREVCERIKGEFSHIVREFREGGKETLLN